jgi:hypothetical protein
MPILGSKLKTMDGNEPIRLDNDLSFCEHGNSLALEFLRKAREAVGQAATGPSPAIASDVNHALREFLLHTSCCPRCNEN